MKLTINTRKQVEIFFFILEWKIKTWNKCEQEKNENLSLKIKNSNQTRIKNNIRERERESLWFSNLCLVKNLLF